MRRAVLKLLAGLTAAGLAGTGLAGCTSNGSAAQAQAGQSTKDGRNLNPCALPSKADLKAVLGADPLGPEPDRGVSLKECSWFAATGDRYAVVQLLNPVSADSPAPDGYGWDRDSFDGAWNDDATPVDGLGDSAWYAPADDGATLYVLHGKFGYAVGLVFMNAQARPAETQILGALKPFAVAVGAKGAAGAKG